MYGWTHELVALLANYGSILYIVAFLPMVWLLGYSVRLAMIVTSGFMALGTLLRSDISICSKIFLHQKYFYLMMHLPFACLYLGIMLMPSTFIVCVQMCDAIHPRPEPLAIHDQLPRLLHPQRDVQHRGG